MSDEANFTSALYNAFLSYLYSQGKIDVPQDFRTRISAIRFILDSDVTGVINTALDYAVNSAANTDFTVECADDTLKALLNEWLRYVNLKVEGMPTGITEVAKEYYKERWREGSFILARCAGWKPLEIGTTSISVPTTIWLVNSASIYVDRKDKKQLTLGRDKYFLDEAREIELPRRNSTGQKLEEIVIQRPFDRVWTEYATPYIVRKGIYRNYKALEMLQEKTEEVITKFMPYLFTITKGTQEEWNQKVDFTDEDMKNMSDSFKEKFEQYKRQKGKTPIASIPFDTKFEHIMPDLKKVIAEELFNQGYRAILSGLGFVDIIQGITSTRKEAVLNPAPFIEEVNAGVEGFKDLLKEIIFKIVDRNSIDHRKLFDRNMKFYIANSPLKMNVEHLLSEMRLGHIYGNISIQTYQEILGVDPNTERERIAEEWERGDRSLFYPYIVQNTEKDFSPEEEQCQT
jgi:hypothetical protein